MGVIGGWRQARCRSDLWQEVKLVAMEAAMGRLLYTHSGGFGEGGGLMGKEGFRWGGGLMGRGVDGRLGDGEGG